MLALYYFHSLKLKLNKKDELPASQSTTLYCINEGCALFHYRAKIEQAYAEGLTKLAVKAQRTSKDALG